jgi:hypothetical protein
VRAAIAILVALGGVAHAEPTAEPEPRPAWMWSLGAVVRATAQDPGASGEVAALEAYGWNAHAPSMTGLRGDLLYLNAPLIDAGVAWTYARGTYASGARFDDPDRIEASTTELGVVARLHWVRPSSPVAAEPRVELGLARTRVDLRGRTDSALGTYTRIGLDLRGGTKKAGVLVSVDYTHTSADTMLELPTGGVTFGFSFYYRHWSI